MFQSGFMKLQRLGMARRKKRNSPYEGDGGAYGAIFGTDAVISR